MVAVAAGESTGDRNPVRHVRYRQGEVGESQRSVHLVIVTPDAWFTAACGRKLAPDRVEETTAGMPCLACIQQAALASAGLTPTNPIDEHGDRDPRDFSLPG